MNLSELLNTALTIITIVTAAGVGLSWNQIRNLKERAKSAEEEAVAMRATRADDKARISQLESDLAAAGRMLRNDAEIVALAHQIEDHNAAALAHWKAEVAVLTEIRDEFRRLADGGTS